MFVFYSVFKVWTARARHAFLFGVLHAISIRESFPERSSRAKRCFIKNAWQPPALPCRLQHSTIGRTDLHRRVRDGNGCALRTHRHQAKIISVFQPSAKTRDAPPSGLPHRCVHSHSHSASHCSMLMSVRSSRPHKCSCTHGICSAFPHCFRSHENMTETRPLLFSLERR